MKGGVNMFRQGDILLKPVKIPFSAKKKDGKVLAYGESTGHSHRFNDGVQLWEDGEKTYLQVFQPSPLIHEEHNPIEIPIGEYEIINEREYDPYKEEVNAVVD